ncbi:adenylate/guanylate cyclase domain-containing protein [Chitinophaga sp. CF418]|uniref:adenylate/guanylate cyclase domain-containing protein n=1 Tax=Chitinophaga sp. CF418 TaxID=1855287 RepID=UPI00091A9141|nr:adenylate/guanylate cyclase domain-containing protein [Chitinophaga sp. CF418]SHN22279.1 Adenylate cyclase, class 3 [Chitinophaga sp. CF418]
MANLEVNRQLRLKYDKSFKEERSLFEHLNIKDPNYFEKAFTDRAVELLPGDYEKYFENGAAAPVFLLFIDVCKFSTRFKNLNGKQISRYFDEYYKIIIPIIYKNGGEIDKIMGDGIVAVFGQPFLKGSEADCFLKADLCARQILYATASTPEFESKVAFHFGLVNYYKNKTQLYNEYTIIGKPVTELFRLESVAVDQTVTFYPGTKVNALYDEQLKRQNQGRSLAAGHTFFDASGLPWGVSYTKTGALPGVDNIQGVFSIEYLK